MDFQDNFKEYLNKKQSENEEMTEKETQELQQAIDKSKESAEQEEQKREYERQAEEIQKRFYQASTSAAAPQEEPASEMPVMSKPQSAEPSPPDRPPRLERSVPLVLSFQDLIDVTGVALKIVYYKRSYNLPFNTSQPLSDRVNSLAKYYRIVHAVRATLARRCVQRAPMPPPIIPSFKLSHDTDPPDDTEQPAQEIYVSRSGRQVKRKMYAEQLEDDSDSDAGLAKKNRGDDPDTKITLDTSFPSGEGSSAEKSAGKAGKGKRDPQKRPTLGAKKYGSRSDELFEKAIESEERKRRQQQEMAQFERTLPQLEEAEGSDVMELGSPVKEMGEHEGLGRRRMTPPAAKGRGRGKRTKDDMSKRDPKSAHKQDSPPGSPVLKRYTSIGRSPEGKGKGKARTQRVREDPLTQPGPSSSFQRVREETIAEPSTSSKIKKVPCPLCHRQYLQSEIEAHAATCGIDDESAGTSGSSIEKIKCELCEREFVMNSDYEAHVKQCIASNVSDL